jgi:hypothetical protein
MAPGSKSLVAAQPQAVCRLHRLLAELRVFAAS